MANIAAKILTKVTTFISKSETIAAFVLSKLAAKTRSLLDYVAKNTSENEAL